MLGWNRVFAIAGAASVWGAVAADATGKLDAADPAAAVPALAVEPVIRASNWLAEPTTTPDQVWRAANDAVRDGEPADHAAMSMSARPLAPKPPPSPTPESE
jgi:hypothetical protein